MKNMKISMKLFVSFLIVVVLAVAIGVVGIYGITTMDNAANVMYSQKALPLGDLTRASEYFLHCRIQARSAILFTGKADSLKTIQSDVENYLTKFETSMANYEPSIATDQGHKLFSDIMDNYATFKPAILQVLNDAKQGFSQEDLLNEMNTTLNSTNVIANALSDLVKARMGVMSDANDANSQLGRELLIIIIAVIVVVALIAMLLAFYISGLISKPIAIMSDFFVRWGSMGDLSLTDDDRKNIEANARHKDEIGKCLTAAAKVVTRMTDVNENIGKVANGDLTVEMDLLSEKDSMGLAIAKMIDNLNSMFDEIHAASTQVSAGAKHIANGAQSLAQGSTEQASSVEELSVSMNEIADKTNQNANIAREASDLSDVIKRSAEKGSEQMSQMMQAVKEINDASSEIQKVIKVIDDIAFQTNILALNAAVEAARAGSAGKGFAVVAEEVRNLAGKSASAAKDTGGLIENSVTKANLGLNIATKTSSSLKEIVEGINRSAEIVTQIARSSDEQAGAIAQVNVGIDQVAQVVQQNSATAEESAAASEEMNGQANMLEELISQFKLKDSGYQPSSSSLDSQGKMLALPKKTAYSSGNDEEYGKY